MELNICILRESKYTGKQYIRTTFTEADLLEWAKQYITDRYTDGEVVDVDVESIIP